MLVLSRKVGESIWIGDDIVVTVTEVDRSKVRLGISAPKEVPVFREELLCYGPADAGTPHPGGDG